MAKSAAIDNTETSSKDDLPHCFVCDVGVIGRHYTLATCRTQATRIRLIEKLGQLVGERYMVVISEEDIICRGCANLINTLDRLESEMGSVRNVVLRFLEKKYALEDGELVNEKNTGVGLPPQITPAPSRSQGFSGTNSNENFMSRKRKAALSDLENEQENGSSVPSKKNKRDSKGDTWMQCDKCKYTTHYNAFMIHHIRQHIKKKNPSCDYCGEEVKSSHKCARQFNAKEPADQPSTSNSSVLPGTNRKSTSVENISEKPLIEPPKKTQQKNDKPSECDSEAETVEMIAAEINEFTGTPGRSADSPDVVISTVQDSTVQNTILATTADSQDSSQIATSEPVATSSMVNTSGDMTIKVATMSHQPMEAPLENEEASNPSGICVMDMSEENSTEEQTLLTVQKMEDDDSNAVYVQVVEMGKGVALDDSGNMTKQVLTVAEDGTVEMVEVMWDEMVTPSEEPEQDMHF